jgi:hypothetical protein
MVTVEVFVGLEGGVEKVACGFWRGGAGFGAWSTMFISG